MLCKTYSLVSNDGLYEEKAKSSKNCFSFILYKWWWVYQLLILRHFWNSLISLKYFEVAWLGVGTRNNISLGYIHIQELL